MSAQTTSELERFHQFLATRLAKGSTGVSPEEALDEWRLENPGQDELAESATAIEKALADMRAGDSGRSATEVIANLRRKYQLPT